MFKRIQFVAYALLWLISVFPQAFAEKENSRITVVFTGDNLLASGMKYLIEKYGESYPYDKVRDVLTQADVVFGNLEAPITDYPHHTTGKSDEDILNKRDFVFKSDPSYSARILKKANFKILSLANNHAMDYGPQGLLDTLSELERAGILFVGAGKNLADAERAAVLEVKGVKIAFLAYSTILPKYSWATSTSPGVNPHPKGVSEKLIKHVREAAKVADVVVVSFHWGVEKSYYPEKYQIEIAHASIDAGADVVVGHHPHVIQGVEFYRGKPVIYSLGNFLFTGKGKKRESFMVRIYIEGGNISGVEVIPLLLTYGKPELTGESWVEDKIREVSRPFGTLFIRKGNVLVPFPESLRGVFLRSE